jgi:poly [ADP-ribose] polymerase 2/3/4
MAISQVARHKIYTMTKVEGSKDGGNVYGHNKYWEIWEGEDGSIKVEWGRISKDGEKPDNPQSREYGPYEKNFDTLCASKERKGYTIPEVIMEDATDISVPSHNLKDIVSEQIAPDNPIVASLLDKLITTNAHSIVGRTNLAYDSDTGLFKTPFGIVTQEGIDKGRDLLYKISQADITDRSGKELIDRYLSMIPQGADNRTNPIAIFQKSDAIQEQSDILDALQASFDALKSGKLDDKKENKEEAPSIFNVELDLVEDGKVIDWIKNKYNDTKQSMHSSSHLNVNRIFKVSVQGMREAFENDGGKMDNIWALWHGTRVSNLLSILAKGLIIPPSHANHCTGRLYGNGIYATDQSTKASNYSYGYWDGGARDNECYMFMCKMAMGKYYTPTSKYGVSYPVSGYDSTFAKAGTSGVYNNEMIVYRVSQVDLQYLVELKG